MPLTIDECWLYVATDDEGNEGLIAFMDPTGAWVPLVCADPERREAVLEIAEKIKAATGQSYEVKHFSLVE